MKKKNRAIAELIINIKLCSSLRTLFYQENICLDFTCLQTKLKENMVNIGVTYCQHVEFPSRCLLPRSGLKLKVNSYLNSSRCCVGTDKHCQLSNPGSLPARH